MAGSVNFEVDRETGRLVSFSQSRLPKVRRLVRPVLTDAEARQRIVASGVAGKLGYKRIRRLATALWTKSASFGEAVG